jgi:hypothetical protein
VGFRDALQEATLEERRIFRLLASITRQRSPLA